MVNLFVVVCPFTSCEDGEMLSFLFLYNFMSTISEMFLHKDVEYLKDLGRFSHSFQNISHSETVY